MKTAGPSPRWRPPGARVLAVLLLTALVAFFAARQSSAQSVTVPADLQAELLAKLAAYDRNLPARAGDRVRVVLLVKRRDVASTLSAAAMKSALGRIDLIAGLPHTETIVPYESAAAVLKLCKSDRVAAVYVTPGFDEDIEALRGALSGADVLSVSAVPDYVPRGIVLGFEVVSGKPKLSLNLTQAKLQNVNFKADVLKLMKVYR